MFLMIAIQIPTVQPLRHIWAYNLFYIKCMLFGAVYKLQSAFLENFCPTPKRPSYLHFLSSHNTSAYPLPPLVGLRNL